MNPSFVTGIEVHKYWSSYNKTKNGEITAYDDVIIFFLKSQLGQFVILYDRMYLTMMKILQSKNIQPIVNMERRVCQIGYSLMIPLIMVKKDNKLDKSSGFMVGYRL